ncbi:MAG: HAMP domain-containing sensor histidine kinase [Deferrisomatales bacterium]|nr:HAMP domain-containing sensor histidine kinase [Deferrisomatales bacterium]
MVERPGGECGEGVPGENEGDGWQAEPVLGAWSEVEALLTALLERLSERGATEGEEAGTAREEGPAAAETLEECRRRLRSIRHDASALGGRLARLQRQQDELLGIVAHDLRTPLVAIQGFSQLLLAAGGLNERQQGYVDRILQAVRTMNRMVEDLRTVRRLDEGRLSLEPRVVSLAVLAQDLVEMHREEARQKEVALRLELDPGFPGAECDPERLRQALGNLVQNAIKFSPRGKEVSIRVALRGDVIRWEVADRGPGFDEGLLPLFFQRFAGGRPGGAGEPKGFGLGLHICREIVALHGGRVGARNEPGGGSCFWAEIPLVPAPVGGNRGQAGEEGTR